MNSVLQQLYMTTPVRDVSGVCVCGGGVGGWVVEGVCDCVHEYCIAGNIGGH